MSHSKVKSNWIDGNLYFYDGAGDVIFYIDGTNRALVIPSGSALTADGDFIVTAPDDVTIEVSDDALAIKDGGVDENKIAAAALDTDYLDGGDGSVLTLSAAAQAAVDLVAAIPETNQSSPAIWNDGGVLKVGTA